MCTVYQLLHVMRSFNIFRTISYTRRVKSREINYSEAIALNVEKKM